MENLDRSYTAGGNIKWFGNSGKVCQVLKKTKCYTTTVPSNCTPGHTSQRNEKLCLQQTNLYMNDYNFIHNS